MKRIYPLLILMLILGCSKEDEKSNSVLTVNLQYGIYDGYSTSQKATVHYWNASKSINKTITMALGDSYDCNINSQNDTLYYEYSKPEGTYIKTTTKSEASGGSKFYKCKKGKFTLVVTAYNSGTASVPISEKCTE